MDCAAASLLRRIVLPVLALSTMSVAIAGQSGKAPEQKPEHRVLKLDGGPPFYKSWLEQDVAWIISDDERASFKLLKDDEERDHFIEQFWARRDPTPDTYENEFEEEHYRRIVLANEHFGSSVPGWKSDRGHVYIMYGSPDRIDYFQSGRSQDKTPEGEQPTPFPLEVWHYRYLEGVGQNVAIEFVDDCRCGAYNINVAPEEKDALFNSPSLPAVTQVEPAGLPPSAQHVGPLPIQFKNLEELVLESPKVILNPLRFEVSTNIKPATDVTSLVEITIVLHNRDLSFSDKDGLSRTSLNIEGRLNTLTGHVAEVFEDTVDAAEQEPHNSDQTTTFSKIVAVRNGRYRLAVAVQDSGGGHSGNWIGGIMVGN